MKKMTKLLSVILAFVMALSCMSMIASAADMKTSYKEVADLKALDAYSPYGTVTRLTTEARMSILLDSLDILLGKANIKLTDMNILGIKIKLDFRSVNLLLESLDSLAGISDMLLSIVGGSIKYVKFGKWQKGMTRENTAQMTIINEILEVLSDNTSKKTGTTLGLYNTDKGLIQQVFDEGLKLGLVGNFVSLDTSAINDLITNLPKGIASIALSMFGRQDDDAAQRENLGNKKALQSGETYAGRLMANAQEFVNGLFTNPMNWTSYRVDADGNDLGYTMALPTEADGTSRYFVFNGNGTIDQYDYKYDGLLGDPKAGYGEEPTVTYTMAKEYDTDDCTTYVYRAPEGYDGDQTLKWYKYDGKVDDNGRIQSSYWLPSVKAAFDSGDLTLNINGADSLLGLLYKFAPYIFREMAPTILNGSAKKLIAEAFDVEFTKIGVKGSAEVAAEAAATGNPDNFFTKDQDYYVWEYSDYKVIEVKNGDDTVSVPYYRFQDTYFKGEIPKNISAYYSMFNWNWNISDDFMDEFIPDAETEIGTKWALDGLNNLVKKAIDTMIADEWTVKGTTYTRAEVFNWQAGGNDKLLNNLMVCARNFFNIAPEEIVDEYFKEAQFYDAMMNKDLATAVNGLTCELVKLIMPQIKFADNIVDQPITAIAAVVVRELCTQLMPTYNFDAMIFANYGDSTNKTRTMLTGKSADYWLDTALYMGVNLGMYYLRNIADVGEDSDLGYFAVMKNLGALPANGSPDGMTFGANAQYVSGTASWLYAIDWIIDWALDTQNLWCWHFGRFVNVDDNNNASVNLATYQNPFNKINAVLLTFAPDLENLLNLSGLGGQTYGSGTFLEKVLKDGLVDSIVNLNVPKLLNMLKIPDNSILKSNNIADTLVSVIVKLLNGILKKVAGGDSIIPASVNSVETLLNQDNLKGTVVNLIAKLYEASNTYQVFDPILPIANFFIGWTTDAQKFADPEVYFSNDWGSTYLYQDNAPKLNFVNNASGMLQTHGPEGADGEDSAYTIQVLNIVCSDGLSAAETSFEVAPGEIKPVALTVPLYNGVAEIDITYKFIGKNGNSIGGEQTRKEYVYCSDITDDLNTPYDSSASLGDKIKDKDYTAIYNYRKYEFTQNIFDAITGYQASVASTASINTNTFKRSPGSMYTNSAPTPVASDYFEHLNDVSKSGFGDVKKDGVSAGYMYKAKDGVTAETNFPYGVYDMGNTAIKYGSSGKDVEVDFIYYNDYNIDDIASKYAGYHYKSGDFVNQTLWTEYETALKNVISLAGVAKKIDYVETIQPQLQPAIKALEKAYKALMASPRTASAITVDGIQAALDGIETNPDRDLSFQDYKLFEYFQYEKQRTSARNMIKSTKAPAPIEDYIENGVWGNELIAAIVEAQADANVKAGINATVVKTTDPKRADEKKANDQAIKDFVAASYSEVELANQEKNLEYYAGFLKANTTDKTFLNKEIAYAEAQNYNKDDYSADSWSRYTEALAKAKAAQSADVTKNSEVFDAKYELMVAQNKLQKHSMKESGYLDEEIIPLIQAANAIIDNFGSLYTTKSNITDTDAFAQLVSALGIKYDVTIDGKEYEGILYDRSALTFAEYDRTETAKNKRAVDEAADKLREAIENFECVAKLEAAEGTQVVVEQGVRYITGVHANSVPTEEALLAKVNVTGATGAAPVVTVSKAGHYGTGARIDIVKDDVLLASYFVVISGDVNGDGAVDAFDAIEVNYANTSAYYMGDVYDDAADINGDGIVNALDYSELTAIVMCEQ